MTDGYKWVVDVDLERFFDRVQHDVVMARVARRVGDRRLLRLIRRYLEAGVMVEGVKQPSAEGTPQGSPLSPLLSNIMLDDLDRDAAPGQIRPGFGRGMTGGLSSHRFTASTTRCCRAATSRKCGGSA